MANRVKPRICRTNEISIPIDTEECVLWLNPVQSVDDIKNPTRDYAWITPDNTVYVFNGHKIVPIFSTNDSHIKWGHVDGDIKDQKDLYEILLKTVNGVKQNGTELPKDLEQKVNVSVNAIVGDGFSIENGSINNLSSLTKRELREAHNIEKLYRANEFEKGEE